MITMQPISVSSILSRYSKKNIDLRKMTGPFVLAGLMSFASIINAQELVYQPINPSFGGNPLNSPHLLATANAQKDSGRSNSRSLTGGLSSQADSDLFLRQLKSRLLSSLASQVSEAIFGENPQDFGTVTFGDQQVTFERTLDSIRLVVLDDATGTETVIEVPTLVTE